MNLIFKKNSTRKKIALLGLSALILIIVSGCAPQTSEPENHSEKINIVATTTMLADLSQIIGGKYVSVEGLMGPGIDPHLYQASAGDVTSMQNADVVIYTGLHLEGKMGEIFESLDQQGDATICIEDGLDSTSLITVDEASGTHDPHIWFDVSIWKSASKTVADGLSELDPDHSEYYQSNSEQYLSELDDLDDYIRERVSEIPEEQRVLITAHDAFNYFGKAYGFEVRGLQGISTDAEAGTADVSALADFIVERQIKAVFVESSVSS